MHRPELTDLEHVREYSGMYVFDREQRGVHSVLFEAIDNAIDQFLSGDATKINVQCNGSHVTVSDDGTGYPFEMKTIDGDSLGTKYLTAIHRKNTADDHFPHIHCLSHGCGLFCLNALTERLKISAWRNGTEWSQQFSRGIPQTIAEKGRTGNGKGTTVDFVIDSEIFSNYQPDTHWLDEQLKLEAYLFPGLKIQFNDREYCFENGLKEMVVDLTLNCNSSQPSLGQSALWKDRPPFYLRYQTSDFMLQAAAHGETNRLTEWSAYANGAKSIEKGTHHDAFQNVLNRMANWRPAVALISVTMLSPQFTGPTRTRLEVPLLKKEFEELISKELAKYCKEHRLQKSM